MTHRLFLILAIAVAAACSNAAGGPDYVATGHAQGGGRRYNAHGPELPDSGVQCADEITWTSLYRDFFGPTSKGTCSGAKGDENNCHLKADAAGTLSSNGYVCGATKDDCFVTFKAVLVPPMMGRDHYFELVLRQELSTGVTPMPLRPSSAVYAECELDRVRRWADNGSKND